MLAQVNRLPPSVRIPANNRITTPLFSINFKLTKTVDIRFAVLVGKKVERSAVKRNQIRRYFQASFLSLLPSLRPGIDILCIAQQKSRESTHQEIERGMERALREKGLLI